MYSYCRLLHDLIFLRGLAREWRVSRRSKSQLLLQKERAGRVQQVFHCLDIFFSKTCNDVHMQVDVLPYVL